LLNNLKPKKKAPKVQDFKFFTDPQRLRELRMREWENPDLLTEEEKEEMKRLQAGGFNDWHRREYQLFVQAIEIYEHNEYEEIAKYVGTKIIEEVEQYSLVFWERIKELQDYDRIQKFLEKRRQKREKVDKTIKFFGKKYTEYRNPVEDMKFDAEIWKNHQKSYTMEEDAFIICKAHEFGYGKWKDIVRAVRTEPKFAMDHAFKLKDDKDIARRVDVLARLLEKEFEERAISAKPVKSSSGTKAKPISISSESSQEEVKSKKKRENNDSDKKSKQSIENDVERQKMASDSSPSLKDQKKYKQATLDFTPRDSILSAGSKRGINELDGVEGAKVNKKAKNES